MIGKTLLEAMNFVDAKYIDEAENKTIQKSGRRWIRLLPLVACLCIVLLGFFSRDRWQMNAESSAMDNESVHDFDENWNNTDREMQSNQSSNYEAEAVPSVILRIDSWNENGFVGTVTELVDSEIFSIGTKLNVIVEEDAWVKTPNEDALVSADTNDARSLFGDGVLVMVQFISYDKETSNIHANVLSPAE